MPDPITHQQYLNWLDHPVTRRLKKELRKARQECLEALADRDDDRLRGHIRCIDEILGWEAGEKPREPQNSQAT